MNPANPFPAKLLSRLSLLLLLLYGLSVLRCSTLRPLWADEVVQLISTTSPSQASMIRSIPINPGATPLGYLTQRPFVLAWGPSAFPARLPSAFFSILSCWLLLLTCNVLLMPRKVGVIAAGIFMSLPSQFRYATEGRPYAEALCFSVLSMLVFIAWLRRPTLFLGFAYVLSVTAALYTQPYAALAPCGAVIYVAVRKIKDRVWRPALACLMLLAIPGILFLPWYFFASETWARGVVVGRFHFNWTSSLPLDFIKGISGGSFLCSAALICLALLGVSLNLSTRSFGPAKPCEAEPPALLLSASGFVLVGVLAVDAARGYFFASRQILFALPALSILAALGLCGAWARNKAVAIALGIWLLATSLWNDVSYQTHFKEDWVSAAHAVAMAAQQGYCLKMADDESLAFYGVFVPDLHANLCGALMLYPKVAVISSLYTDSVKLNAARLELQRHGFVLRGTGTDGGTTIAFEERANPDFGQKIAP